MAHYMIGLMHVTDPTGMDEYVRRVGSTVERYGGEFVFEGEVVEVVEGPLEASGGAVIKFDDATAAMRWFESPEYDELKQMRASKGQAHHVLMHGHPRGEG